MNDIETATVTLDNYKLGGRSLQQWHTWLTTDHKTGRDQGHLGCPLSRYGRVSTECAWWAIAAAVAVVEDNSEDIAAMLDGDYHGFMSMAVNDSVIVAETVRGGIDHDRLPACLLEYLDLSVLDAECEECGNNPADTDAGNGLCIRCNFDWAEGDQ